MNVLLIEAILIRFSFTENMEVSIFVVEKLFQRYFFKGDDISKKSILLEVALEAGMNSAIIEDLFEKNWDSDLIAEEENIARNMGITAVPCFIVNGKYAIPGAQEPSVLTNIFDLAIHETK